MVAELKNPFLLQAPSYLSMQLDKAKEGEVGTIQIYRCVTLK